MNRKLLNKYGGPYRIAKMLVNDRYKVTTVKGLRGYKNFHATVAVDSLKRYLSTVPGDEHCDNEEAVKDRQGLIDLLDEYVIIVSFRYP